MIPADARDALTEDFYYRTPVSFARVIGVARNTITRLWNMSLPTKLRRGPGGLSNDKDSKGIIGKISIRFSFFSGPDISRSVSSAGKIS